MIIKADNYLINLVDFISINNNPESNTVVIVNDMFNYVVKVHSNLISEEVFEAIVEALKNKEEFFEIDLKYIEEVIQGFFEVIGEE